MLGLFDIQNAALGGFDGGGAARKMGKVTGKVAGVLVPLEHALEGASEVQKNAPAGTVAVGVAGKSAIHGGGILAGMKGGAALGTLVGSAFPAVEPIAIPFGTAVGAFVGGEAMGRLLGKVSNRNVGEAASAIGRKLQEQMEAQGRNRYSYNPY